MGVILASATLGDVVAAAFVFIAMIVYFVWTEVVYRRRMAEIDRDYRERMGRIR